MREIKFRAWDSKRKEMRGVRDMAWDGHGGIDVAYKCDIMNNYGGSGEFLMQFTGLKDKNGKEIYEFDYLGDYCVFWGSGKYILQNISTGDIMDCNEKNTQQKEVTGNRFETLREHSAMATDL